MLRMSRRSYECLLTKAKARSRPVGLSAIRSTYTGANTAIDAAMTSAPQNYWALKMPLPKAFHSTSTLDYCIGIPFMI